MTEKSSPEPGQEKALRERELRIQRQIAFASGIFQEDVVKTLPLPRYLW